MCIVCYTERLSGGPLEATPPKPVRRGNVSPSSGAELNVWSLQKPTPTRSPRGASPARVVRAGADHRHAARELLGLKWTDIDFGAGTLAVRRALQWQRGIGLVFVEPKTARSRRKIHLSQTALAALRAHKDRQTFDRQRRRCCVERSWPPILQCHW